MIYGTPYTLAGVDEAVTAFVADALDIHPEDFGACAACGVILDDQLICGCGILRLPPIEARGLHASINRQRQSKVGNPKSASEPVRLPLYADGGIKIVGVYSTEEQEGPRLA